MAKLNFKKFGEGEPLIILHGLYGSSDNWVTVARELMTNFMVFNVDLRNHGASPHLPEHNYDVMTDDLVEFMDNNAIYSAIILGHSMGGKAAMNFTALYPERVKRLIVVDISPRTYLHAEGDGQEADHIAILNALLAVDLCQIKTRNEVNELLAIEIKSAIIRQFLLKNLKRNRDSSYAWKINLKVLKQNLRYVLQGLEKQKNDIQLFIRPTLFVKGANSNYIQLKDEQMIYDFFKNVRIETINNASHWVHAEQTDEFVMLVRNFCLT